MKRIEFYRLKPDCLDCVYHSMHRLESDNPREPPEHMCHHPVLMHRFETRYAAVDCIAMREKRGRWCGPEGRFFNL